MSIQCIFEQASSGLTRVPNDWMPATAVRSFIFDDPVLVWLDFYRAAEGFHKDSSPYEFTDFIFEKGREFERKWISEIAPEAVRVFEESYEARDTSKFRQTLERF